MKDVEKIIGEINGTMTLSSMPLTEEDKERLRMCITGEASADEMVKQLVEKYSQKTEV